MKYECAVAKFFLITEHQSSATVRKKNKSLKNIRFLIQILFFKNFQPLLIADIKKKFNKFG